MSRGEHGLCWEEAGSAEARKGRRGSVQARTGCSLCGQRTAQEVGLHWVPVAMVKSILEILAPTQRGFRDLPAGRAGTRPLCLMGHAEAQGGRQGISQRAVLSPKSWANLCCPAWLV